MNKLRPRTIRRLAVRNAYRDSNVTSGQCRRALAQTTTGDSNDRPQNFEIQRRDKSGRWRKAPGVDRVHTFGLARLRAQKATRYSGPRFTHVNGLPVVLDEAFPPPVFRVRDVMTGQTWTV